MMPLARGSRAGSGSRETDKHTCREGKPPKEHTATENISPRGAKQPVKASFAQGVDWPAHYAAVSTVGLEGETSRPVWLGVESPPRGLWQDASARKVHLLKSSFLRIE